MGKDDLRKMIDEGDFTSHNNISFHSFDGEQLIL